MALGDFGMESPSGNGVIGSDHRDAAGRFTAGNPGGPGNPSAAKVAKFRAALLAAVTEDDITAIVAKLVQLAKAGDIDAARLILDRLMGKPIQPSLVELNGAADDSYANCVQIYLPATDRDLP